MFLQLAGNERHFRCLSTKTKIACALVRGYETLLHQRNVVAATAAAAARSEANFQASTERSTNRESSTRKEAELSPLLATAATKTSLRTNCPSYNIISRFLQVVECCC